MKRTVILSLVLLTIAVLAWSLTDTGADEHSAKPEQVINEIRDEMGLSTEGTIDPDAVPEQLLEQLGDAVMSEIHPNERVHSWMDRMMGPGMMGRSWGMNGSDYGSIPYNSPEEVLKQRYARGEISREEYFQALEDLKR